MDILFGLRLPRFDDLNKSLNELFEKYFKIYNFNFDVDCHPDRNVDLLINGAVGFSTHTLNGGAAVKYQINRDISIGCQYYLNNVFTPEITVKEIFLNGMTNRVIFNIIPGYRYNSIHLKNSFRRWMYNVTMDFDIIGSVPNFSLSTVMRVKEGSEYIIGGKLNFDNYLRNINVFKLAVGLLERNMSIICILQNINFLDTSFCFNFSDGIIVGTQIQINYFSRLVTGTLAGHFPISDSFFIKGKINTENIIGLAFGLYLKNDLLVSCCCKLNRKFISLDSLQFGFGLEYEN